MDFVDCESCPTIKIIDNNQHVSLSHAEEKKALDRFEEYCVETMRKRREEGASSEDTILSDLSNVSLQDLPSKDVQQKDGNSGSLGKRKRKTTAVMKESLDQEKEQDMGKKRRKGNTEKENINGTNQLATAKQKGKKVNEKKQQETAAKSAVDSMGQLMFASKYGSKFPSNPTSPPYATPIPTASAPQAAHPVPAAHGDNVASTKPPVPTATAPHAHLLPAAYSNAATLTKQPTATATAPQAAHLLPAVPVDTVPSTKSPNPTTLAPQAADLLPAEALGDTEPSTNPPIPTSPALQAAYSYQLPAAPDPALQASYPDTSISQTWAECDRALVLSGLRDILNNPPRDDDVIIVENDQNTPQQALSNKSTTPSTLGTFTVEKNLQKIAAENKKLEAENTSLKAELSALKGQLAIMAPGE